MPSVKTRYLLGFMMDLILEPLKTKYHVSNTENFFEVYEIFELARFFLFFLLFFFFNYLIVFGKC